MINDMLTNKIKMKDFRKQNIDQRIAQAEEICDKLKIRRAWPRYLTSKRKSGYLGSMVHSIRSHFTRTIFVG